MWARTHILARVLALTLGSAACGSSSPSSPTPSEPTGVKIDDVALSRRGVDVGAGPVTLDAQEYIDLTIHLTVTRPPSETITMYWCVLESATAIGTGTCIAVTTTVNQMITPFKTAMRPTVPTTTNYVYVAFMQGTIPWTGAFTKVGSPPKTGDVFGINRVLDVYLAPRTITFR